MCLLAIEILFFVAGIWLLISGKIPTKLFQLLFGKGDYQLSTLHARLFGLLLSTPVPVVLGVSFLLGLLFPRDSPALFATIFEIIYDFAVAIAAIIIARKSRRKSQGNPVPVSNGDNLSQ